jgi:2'-5' RNA ligase
MRPSTPPLRDLASAGPPAAARAGSQGGPAYFTALLEDPQGLLAEAQQVVFDQMEGTDYAAQDPARFHLTLVHVPDISDDDLDAVLADLMGLPAAFQVEMVESTTLYSVNGIPLVLRVNPNPALVRLQSDLVRAIKARGRAVSTYSEPEEYEPHVTLALDLQPPEAMPGDIDEPFRLWVREFVITRNDYQETRRVRLPATVGERVLVTAGPPFYAHVFQRRRVRPRPAAPPAAQDLTPLIDAIRQNTAAVLRAMQVAPPPAPPPNVDVTVQAPVVQNEIPAPVVNIEAPIVRNEIPAPVVNIEARFDGLVAAIERQTQEVLAQRSADQGQDREAVERMTAALAEQAEVLKAAVQRESMDEVMAPFAAALEKVGRALMSLATKPSAPAELHVDFPAYRVTKKVVRDPETHAIDEVVEIFEPE